MHAIGEDNFKAGIQNYIANRAYKISSPDYLSEAMEEAIKLSSEGIKHKNLTFKQILDSWHTQIGYPILHIEFDRIQGDITIIQKPFQTPPATSDPQNKTRWWIPFNFITSVDDPKRKESQSTHPYEWLGGDITIITPNDKPDLISTKWVLFNKQQTGYYRVHYDEGNWKELIKALKAPNASFITTLSRSQLLDDAFVFAENGLFNYTILLELLRYLPVTEDSHIPWFTFFDHIDSLKNQLIGSDIYPKYEVSC